MKFTRVQKQAAYKQLSDKVKDFIMDNETTELIENMLKESGLSEEEREAADTEVFNAMLGLQNLSSVITNISEITKKNPSEFEKLKNDLEESIFSKINTSPGLENDEFVEKVSSNNIGNSFEEIILNQAIAMQPARNTSPDSASMAGEPASATEEKVGGQGDNLQKEVEKTMETIPENLPIEEKREETESKNIHNYKSGQDPYREPIE